jgi:hypothetical protein
MKQWGYEHPLLTFFLVCALLDTLGRIFGGCKP